MGKKRYTTEEIVSKRRQVDVLTAKAERWQRPSARLA